MTLGARQLGLLAGAAGCSVAAWADPDVTTFEDHIGDAVLRRTDSGANGAVHPLGVLPDVRRVSLQGWQPNSPASDPWTGVAVSGSDAHIFRLDLVFSGVVNPPGPIGIGGSADPYRFGPSPVYGFVEIDVDDDHNTGGEPEPVARGRYLANVARFGRRPDNSLGERIAVWSKDYNAVFSSAPQYERNGAEFVLTLCGCLDTTVLYQTNAPGGTSGVFEAGETWIILDRFFQRSGGYKCASAAFGGTGFGLYDPPVLLKWSHSPAMDETTVTLVYALDMQGAASLTGQPVQAANFSVQDHTSVYEALRDVVLNSGSLTGSCAVLCGGWNGADPHDELDPTRWDARVLVGTAYSQPEDTLYAWTDTGFEETPADVSGDGVVDSADRLAVQQFIAQLDGGPDDADGVVNGSVQLVNFGPNFHLADINGDGVVGGLDISAICPVDYNGDGTLSVSDFGGFQLGWVLRDPRADFNHDGFWTVGDLGSFQTAFVVGCP